MQCHIVANSVGSRSWSRHHCIRFVFRKLKARLFNTKKTFSFVSYVRKDIFLNLYFEWQLDVLCISNFDMERVFQISISLKIESGRYKQHSLSKLFPHEIFTSFMGSMVSFISYRFSPMVVTSSAVNLSVRRLI